jgi:pyrimidine-specific ribonucleoside hydrolase
LVETLRVFSPGTDFGASRGDPVHRVIIDSDPGIDDAMTLALAARSPDIELRAVTTVAGNVPLGLSTANALALLGALGRDDVPVAAGADRGLVRVKPVHRAVHGADGLGGVILPVPPRRPAPHHAVAEMAHALQRAEPGGLTIVAIGPLTNVALLLALHPELSDRIGRVVIMGGSAGAGNVTRHAEYNAWADPEAADRVLGSGLDISLAQLQATRHATLDPVTRRELAGGSRIGAQLISMMNGYDEGAGVNPALHDVVALAAVIDPALVRSQRASVHVVTDAGSQRGATLVDFDGASAETPGVDVIVEVDVEGLRRLLVERLVSTDAR